jgi:AcrR family transcriptional regulator/DNA-binding MarR family transcriptional regulator
LGRWRGYPSAPRSEESAAFNPIAVLTPMTDHLDRAGRLTGHVVQMQRRRLLNATTEIVYERGVQALTAVVVAKRAGMSHKTFYDLFSDREGCLLAAFEEAVGQATQAVEQSVAGQKKWRERVRAGLTSLLSYFDYDPLMGRLLIVEALGSGGRTLQARQRVFAQIVAIVEEGRTEAKAGLQAPPLTAEGIVGAVFSIIHARMVERDSRPLLELTGPLMATIVHPYLGPAAAQRELTLPGTPHGGGQAGDRPVVVTGRASTRLPVDPFKDLSMRVTYRTVHVLSSIAASPGASSKQIADASGVTDGGQTSKLLHRLERNGLIKDSGVGTAAKWMPRAWSLTELGEEVLRVVGEG